VNCGKERTREKERVSARPRVRRKERGKEREREGIQRDDAMRDRAREEGVLLTRRLKILFVEKVG